MQVIARGGRELYVRDHQGQVWELWGLERGKVTSCLGAGVRLVSLQWLQVQVGGGGTRCVRVLIAKRATDSC